MPLLLLLAALPVASDVGVKVRINSDGTVDTAYPAGNKPVSGACPSGWTCAVKGDGVQDIDEVSATEFQMTVSGSDDEQNFGYVYQTEATDTDIQIEARIPTTANWTGWKESYTGFGVGLTEGTGDTDFASQCWWPYSGTAVVAKHDIHGTRVVEQGTATETLPEYVAMIYDDSATEIECCESNDGSTWNLVGTTKTKSLTFPAYGYVFGTSHDPVASTTANLTAINYTNTIDITCGAPGTPDRNVFWTVGFETGYLLSRAVHQDDGISLTQLDNITPECSIYGITQGNPGRLYYDPSCDDSQWKAETGFLLSIGAGDGMVELDDVLVRVCDDYDGDPNDSGTLSRAQDFFEVCADNWPLYIAKSDTDDLAEFPIDTRSMTAHDTEGGTMQQWEGWYASENCCSASDTGPAAGVLCRVEDSTNSLGADSNISPRNGSYFFRCEIRYNLPYEVWGGGSTKNKPRYTLMGKKDPDNGASFHWDEEVWIGFSIYVPTDTEVEDLSSIEKHWLGNMVFTLFGLSDENDHIQIRIQSIAGVNHWTLTDRLSDTDTTQTTATATLTDLGAISQGEWTDFVIRFRANPFDTLTNASQVNNKGQDKIFQANKGILQVWVGPESDPALTLKRDVENAPVGLVPQEGAFLSWDIRNYKYGWHHNGTTMQGPIYSGWDDVRFGKALRDGTSYSDVHPDGDSEPP